MPPPIPPMLGPFDKGLGICGNAGWYLLNAADMPMPGIPGRVVPVIVASFAYVDAAYLRILYREQASFVTGTCKWSHIIADLC